MTTQKAKKRAASKLALSILLFALVAFGFALSEAILPNMAFPVERPGQYYPPPAKETCYQCEREYYRIEVGTYSTT